MREAGVGEVDADARKRLPLRLVDCTQTRGDAMASAEHMRGAVWRLGSSAFTGHGEGDAHGELPAAPLEGEGALLRVECDARDEDDVALVRARARDLRLEQPAVDHLV